MELSIIVAVGRNNEIGKDNDLIWRFRDDMKFFKETTMGHKMVMGRKTFESLPGLLPGREHLVLTRQELEFPNEVTIYKGIKEFLETYKDYPEEIFNIGGASIYNNLFEYANRLYLTEINAEAEADVFFPEFDKDMYSREVLAENHDEKQNIDYQHVLYQRRDYGKR